MKRCLVLTGGRLDLAFAGSFLEKEEFHKIVAVDGGLKAARALGITPDVIVGDFDSADPSVLACYRKQEHIIWEVHQPEKDDTDTELALKRAMAMACTEIVLLGATGGRLDHMIGNIQLLYPCLRKESAPVLWIPRTASISLMGRLYSAGKKCGENTFPSCPLLRKSAGLP